MSSAKGDTPIATTVPAETVTPPRDGSLYDPRILRSRLIVAPTASSSATVLLTRPLAIVTIEQAVSSADGCCAHDACVAVHLDVQSQLRACATARHAAASTPAATPASMNNNTDRSPSGGCFFVLQHDGAEGSVDDKSTGHRPRP